MAEMLVQSMEEPLAPEEYHDEYRDAVLQLIDEKVRGGGERDREAARGGARRKRAPRSSTSWRC